MEQEITDCGSGISWTIRKSLVPSSRQITTPASVNIYGPDALQNTIKHTVSKHWRQVWCNYHSMKRQINKILNDKTGCNKSHEHRYQDDNDGHCNWPCQGRTHHSWDDQLLPSLSHQIPLHTHLQDHAQLHRCWSLQQLAHCHRHQWNL